MILSILNALKEKNIIEFHNISDYEYYFNNRANINMFLYDKKNVESLLFLKISDLRDFREIYEKMTMIYNKVPKIIPEPIDFFHIKKFNVLVTKAYKFDLLINKSRLNNNKRKKVVENVVENIKKLQSKTIEKYIEFDENFCKSNIFPKLTKLFNRWQDDELLYEFENYINKLSIYYGMKFPCIPQHGDLVMYNTGLIDGKIDQIFFIDWDSYSEIKLPMYDLLIFVSTFVKFYGEDMYTDSDLNRHINVLFTEYCDALFLDRQFVLDLYPICFLLFASLKADIGIFTGQEFALKEIKQFLLSGRKLIFNVY